MSYLSIIFTSLTILICSNLLSQDAHNFSITDTDGITHDLYEDYLDKGTTVVLKFFFVDCPPCNGIAPFVQELYEEWGEGNFDVQFIELSIKESDDNDYVSTYKNRHNLTFPGAGEDGNAMEAVEPYILGEFGNFRGTPSFAVIAPDKSVLYNTGGAGNQGKMDNLSQAIADTGAIGDPANYVAPSGFNISATTASGQNDDDLIMTLGDMTDLSIAYPIDSSSFSITSLEEDYPGITEPVIRFSKSGSAKEKVNSLDILLIRKHILSIIPITDEAMKLAADSNGDGNINALDMLILRKLVLNIITELPTASFKFIPNELPLSLNPGATQQFEVKSIKIGDLDGN